MATFENMYQLDLRVALGVWARTCDSTSAEFALVPGQAIQCYNASHERPLMRILLQDWTAFEHGYLDWDHDDFARLLALGGIPADVLLILVTDEGLRERRAYRFTRKDFQLFAGWYSDMYSMDFFQPADYLIFDEELRYVRILHHEGAVFRSA